MRFLFIRHFSMFEVIFIAVACAAWGANGWFTAMVVIAIGSLVSVAAEKYYKIPWSKP